ncbi:kinesin-like protein KIF25 [Myripristis murdjan]|uniref:Kinesin family member 25 n=1 Tax=Myripristis murdjan TaxID=586833 RepID=A0A667YRS4_9TELE|nr:kinesin-like protein KIF25 [Myripristis murdjan]XP_029903292.1 kinesin-like protein KIF25 [Myripristis murdjan]XP_029903293.1 kinesin-like protein KIF25 [Myripristis murdjan]XP_029903294.1 kinesin-like protein KIF25 [Myripristis murdjan]
MPLFINRDQIFAHQVHLLEHKLRSKEERILELETENAILHLRLAECLGKLRREKEEETKAQKNHQNQKNSQKITQSALAKLLSEVQAVKQDLSEVFGVYVNFATELQEKSKELQEKVEHASSVLKGHRGDDVQSLQDHVAALECSLEEEKQKCREERQRRRELHNTLVELRGNIRVHCRVRPVLHFDHVQPSTLTTGPALSEEVVYAVSDDTVLVNCMKTGIPVQNKMFEFERVHGPEDSQDAVFEEVKPLLTSLLDGYNVCIMAYGQTGSGKTHTMMGSQPMKEAQQGIIPKAAAELFRLISEKPAESHTVEVSVMEVYNNEVFDLLARDEDRNSVDQRRDIITTSTGTSQVTALTYEPVSSASEVMQVISGVLKLRARCPTLVHTDSSRSHLIVTLTISSNSPNALALARRLQSAKKDMQRSTQREWWSPRCRRANPSARLSSDELFASPASSPCHSPCHSPCPSPRPSISQAPFKTKLQLVDLAGSECVGMSGVSGAALWETSCINRSLSALSDVLGALAEQRPHVPYRNSKLTHLLQDAIGGDAKLLVMLCVSPTQRFITESLQSLGFGTRARQVQKEMPKRKKTPLK